MRDRMRRHCAAIPRRGPGELEAGVLAALVGAPGPVTAG